MTFINLVYKDKYFLIEPKEKNINMILYFCFENDASEMADQIYEKFPFKIWPKNTDIKNRKYIFWSFIYDKLKMVKWFIIKFNIKKEYFILKEKKDGMLFFFIL